LIPAALHAAVGRQMDAQQASGLRTLYPFGGAWPARYEELVVHLRDVPGVAVVRPFQRSFEVVVANNVVLLPFEYAKDLRTKLDDRGVLNSLNKLTIELLQRYGPEPSHLQLTLDGLAGIGDDVDNGRPELLRGLTPNGVVIVFYAADFRTGLLRVGWGEAAIGVGNGPVWKHTEDLPLHPAVPLPGVFAWPAAAATGTAERRTVRFDAVDDLS
jgi:hypothetical protein